MIRFAPHKPLSNLNGQNEVWCIPKSLFSREKKENNTFTSKSLGVCGGHLRRVLVDRFGLLLAFGVNFRIFVSVTQRGEQQRGGQANAGKRKQTQTNASKRKQTQRRKRKKHKQTQANASKRGQTQTNAYTPLYCCFLHPPLQSP